MMDYMNLWLMAGASVLGLMVLLWLVSLALRNSSIVDIFWGTGFVIVTWIAYALTPEGYGPRRLLLATLVTIWGLRLSLYILWRNWGKPEDFRYAQWREDAGPRWWWFSFFKVFLLQGVLLWIISAPLVVGVASPTPASLGLLEALGVLVWAYGFFFEAVGDLQLARFKADPANRGKLMDRGVWRYTRHPVGFLLNRRRHRHRRVDDLQPGHHDLPARARLGRRHAGEDPERNQAGLSRVHGADQRVRAAPAAPGRLNGGTVRLPGRRLPCVGRWR
jgi:steroid 5-alpha reductase family enzyme